MDANDAMIDPMNHSKLLINQLINPSHQTPLPPPYHPPPHPSSLIPSSRDSIDDRLRPVACRCLPAVRDASKPPTSRTDADSGSQRIHFPSAGETNERVNEPPNRTEKKEIKGEEPRNLTDSCGSASGVVFLVSQENK